MEKNSIVTEISNEMLGLSAEEQAQTIAELDQKYVAKAALFFLENDRFDFLKFLPVSVLVLLGKNLLRSLLMINRYELGSQRATKWLRRIVDLRNFDEVWQSLSKEKPCAAFDLIPLPLLYTTIQEHLTRITGVCDYKQLLEIVQKGSRARTLLDLGIFDETGVEESYRKDDRKYDRKMKSLGDVKNPWLVSLMATLPASTKLKLLYDDQARTLDLKKLFCFFIAQGDYVNDVRSSPRPLMLAFLDPIQGSDVLDQKFDDRFAQAIERFAEDFSSFTERVSTPQVRQLLNFLQIVMPDDDHRSIVIQALPIKVISKLLRSKHDIWIKKYLAPDQMAVFENKSLNIVEAHEILSKSTRMLQPSVVEKIMRLDKKDKLQLLAMQ